MDFKNFKPSDEMIKAAELVFLSMAEVETIKPIVKAYQKKILNKYQFKDDEGNIITEEGRSYLMGDADFKVYLDECNTKRLKVGLYVKNKEYCPLLVAESDLTDAERLLINSFKPITGLDCSDIYLLEHRKKFLNLALGLMSNFIDSKQILKTIIKEAV